MAKYYSGDPVKEEEKWKTYDIGGLAERYIKVFGGVIRRKENTWKT